MITRRAIASSLVAVALLIAPALGGETQLRGAQAVQEQQQPQQQEEAPPKQALPNAYGNLTKGSRVEQFSPHFLPIDDSKLLPRVQNYDYHEALISTWDGMKKRTIDPYWLKLVHRPRSETPDDAVSEGVGYGLLWALYMNDQEYFNHQLDNADKFMWNGRIHDWRVDVNGGKTGTGAATDAEEDIALACIFAQHLVDKGVWQYHQVPSGAKYGDRAQQILDAFWSTGMIADGKFVAPGAGWGGRDFVNPGYFSPAWYKIFKQVDRNGGQHNWQAVIDQCYDSILKNVGASKGMVPDWMTPWGDYYWNGLGYNAYLDGHALFKDAIRILWRVAVDYAWFGEPRAKQFLDKSYAFIESVGGPSAANFFTMQGQPVPKTDFWQFDGNRRSRHRFEHSHLTTAMWATAAYASQGPDGAQPYSDELLKFYENGDYWGNAVDPTGFNEDTDHNELYFDQFLAFFGASLISGYFVDITQAV